MSEKIKNHGLIVPKIETREEGAEHLFGAIKKLRGVVINPTGKWAKYLPQGELQNKGDFEPNACVSFGMNHAKQTLYKFVTGKDNNDSDRALAIGSDTDPARGNDPHKVAEYARAKLGFVREELLPFNDAVKTLASFYSPKPLTKDLIQEGNLFFKEYEFYHEWVFTSGTPESKRDLLKDALTKGTVCVSVRAWEHNGKYYTKKVGAPDSHWVQLVEYDDDGCPIVFDSYAESDSTPYLKTLDPLYDFGIAKIYYLIPAEPKRSLLEKIIALCKEVLGLQKKAMEAKKEEEASVTTEIPPFRKITELEKKQYQEMVIEVLKEEKIAPHEGEEIYYTIACESGFNPFNRNINKDKSTDWGICMFNDGPKTGKKWWIGEGAPFASVKEVIENPRKCVQVMCRQWKRGYVGKKNWVCFSSGAWKEFKGRT